MEDGKFTLRPILEKKSDSDGFFNFALSPDGKTLLTIGDEDGTGGPIHIWQLPRSVWPEVNADDIPLDRKFGGRLPVKGLAFLSDTHALTTAVGTGTGSLPELHVWDLEAGRVEVAIPLPFDVRAAAVSGDHKFVLVAENKQGPGAQRVARFNLDILKLSPDELAEQAEKVWGQSLIPPNRKSYEILQLKLEPAWTISLEQATEELKCFHNDEAFLVRNHRGRVALYRSEDGGFVSELAAAKVEAMSLAPDGKLLLVKYEQGGGHLLRADHGFKVNELKIAATSRVTATDWCADGRCVITADAGGQISVWSLATGEAVHSFSTGGEPIANVRIGSNRKRIYSSGEHGVAVWDLAGQLLARGEAPPFAETSLALSPDQKNLLSGGQSWQSGASKDDHSLRLWRLPESVWPKRETSADPSEKLTLENRLDGHEFAAEGACVLAATDDGRMLISAGGYDKTARLWDVETRETLLTFKTHSEEAVSAVAISGDGKIAAIRGQGQDLDIWDLEGKKVLHDLDAEADFSRCLAIAPDAKSVVTLPTKKGISTVWDVSSGQKRFEHDFDGICYDCRFVPGTNRLVIAAETGWWSWDVATGELSGMGKTVNMSVVTAIDVSADGSMFAVAAAGRGLRGTNHSVQIRDMNTGKQIIAANGHTQGITSLRFLPGDRHLISTSRDGTLRIWRVPERNPQAISAGREVLRQEFPDMMWNTFVPLPDGRVATFGFSKEVDPLYGQNDVLIWQLPESVWPEE